MISGIGVVGDSVGLGDAVKLWMSFGFKDTLLEDPGPLFLFLAKRLDLTLGAELGLLVLAINGLGLGDELENGLWFGDELEIGFSVGNENGLGLGEEDSSS